MVALETLGIAVSVLLGIMPLYLMLARIHRDIGRLSADHSNLDGKVDRIEETVGSHEKAIDTAHGDD